MRSFLTKLTFYAGCIAIVVAAVNQFFSFFREFQLFTWLSLLFFYGITLLAGYIAFRALEKSGHGFVASTNGIVMLKLFLSVAFVITYALIVKPENISFIISFFILYLLFTVFEVREFIFMQKKKAQREKLKSHGG